MIVDRNDMPGDAPSIFVMVSVIPEQHASEFVLRGYGEVHMHSEEVDGKWQHWVEVVAEKSKNCLIRFDIRKESRYELQHDSIIVVEDRQAHPFKDFAISCSQVNDSDYIWRWICEKTGKDYLEIKEGEFLELPTLPNLPRLHSTVQQRHELVFYYIRNSPNFMRALEAVFEEAHHNNNPVELRQLVGIFNQLLQKMGQHNIAGLFSRENFELLLRVKTYQTQIDYLKMWRQRQVIRSLLALGEAVNQRIYVYHAAAFYREFLVDFKTQHFLNHILESEICDCCTEIAVYLASSNVLEELIDLPALAAVNLTAPEKIEAEEETFAPEAQALRKKQLAERKVEFLLQALSITKSVKVSSVRANLYEKMLSTRVMTALGEFLDQNVMNSLEVLVALAKVYPLRFLEVAKRHFREGVEDCYRKMVNKFSFVSEDWQLAILAVFRSLGESLLAENSHFVVDSFVVTNIEKYRDERSILLMLAELLDFFETWKVLHQAMQSRLFVYLGQFLTSIQSARPDHHISLRVTKIMKKVVAESARSSITVANMPILQEINYQVVQHGFFGYFMLTFQRNFTRNNMVVSGAHLIFKMLSSIKTQTRYHRYLLKKYRGFAVLEKYFPEIMMPAGPVTPGLGPMERRESRTEMQDESLELLHRESKEKENRLENGQFQQEKEKQILEEKMEVVKEVEQMVEENQPTFRQALDLALPTLLQPIEPQRIDEQIKAFEPEPIEQMKAVEQFPYVLPIDQIQPILSPQLKQTNPLQPTEPMQVIDPIEPIEYPAENQPNPDFQHLDRPTKRRKQSFDEREPLPAAIPLHDYDEPEGNK